MKLLLILASPSLGTIAAIRTVEMMNAATNVVLGRVN